MAKPRAFALGQGQGQPSQSIGRGFVGRGFPPSQNFHHQQMPRPGGPQSFAADTNKGPSNPGNTAHTSGNMPPRDKVIKCYECGEFGHVRSNCPKSKI